MTTRLISYQIAIFTN